MRSEQPVGRDSPGAVPPGTAALADENDSSVTWSEIGLDTMASMLVVSLGRNSSHSFTGRCQWPRLHPLNERRFPAAPHPLIMVESTRQLARAIERRHLREAAGAALEPVSVSAGLRPQVQPQEAGSATAVEARLLLSDLSTCSYGPTSYRVTAEFAHGGVPFASCTMLLAAGTRPWEFRSDEGGLARLLHPPAAAVGAAADTDVMVARAPQGRLVLLPRDPGHPVLLPGRPDFLPAPAVLEAGRQATLLHAGRTADAVVGLSVDLRGPVPSRGAAIEVDAESGGARFLVTAAGRAVATGSVMLLQP
ncbi:hypothetical protein [Streptomyces luteolus]|uniref:A-factor biosynthesis hotdog domain-containing protein n=1 Tax=Streptomyces luteolus TaxID=3043615 RepID=A0ABT6SQK4_9ACTN|nr:hypothetical protein [Streptomyces sp. B-S-A12]MDI3417635.1 hypothetical protein [Streptomyces sp. B-S-A12]